MTVTSVANEQRPARLAAIMSLLLCAGCAAPPLSAQGDLHVTLIAGKTEFFEGEPIYAVIRVVNDGLDTVWVMPPEFGVSLALSGRAENGGAIPENRLFADYFYPDDWRGIPLAPGEPRHEVVILQHWLGDLSRSVSQVYDAHLASGRYRVVVRYDPNFPTNRGPGLEVLESSPVVLIVRPRTLTEEASYREVEALRRLAWDRTTSARYYPVLLDLLARRHALDSTDTFLPFLLGDGVVTAQAVAGVRLDVPTVARLAAMGVATASALRQTPAGAKAALGALPRRPSDAPRLSDLLGASLAGEVARDHERRVASRRTP